MNFLGPPILLVLSTAASMALHFVGYGYFMVLTCGVSDTAESHPAAASAQGWVCGANTVELWEVPGAWILGASAILAVAAAVALWSRGGSWRWVAPLGLVATPLLTLVLLSLPPDGCTGDARQTHTAYQCATTSDG